MFCRKRRVVHVMFEREKTKFHAKFIHTTLTTEYQQQQQKKQLLQLTIIHQLNNSATMAYAKHGGSICGGTAIVSPYLGAQTNADCYERLSSASKHDYSRTAYRGNYDERGRMLQKRRISTETPLQHNSSSSKANGSRAKKNTINGKIKISRSRSRRKDKVSKTCKRCISSKKVGKCGRPSTSAQQQQKRQQQQRQQTAITIVVEEWNCEENSHNALHFVMHWSCCIAFCEKCTIEVASTYTGICIHNYTYTYVHMYIRKYEHLVVSFDILRPVKYLVCYGLHTNNQKQNIWVANRSPPVQVCGNPQLRGGAAQL